MMSRGSFSFVAMLVINPVVILFYQNCSMTPVSHASNAPAKPAAIERQVASTAKAEVIDLKDSQCPSEKKECPRAE